MIACPTCGCRNHGRPAKCIACGEALSVAPLPSRSPGDFFTPLPSLLMLGVPLVAAATVLGYAWLDDHGYQPRWWTLNESWLEKVLIVGVSACAALGSAAGWTLAAARWWLGSGFARRAVFFILGLVLGLAIYGVTVVFVAEASNA